MWLGGTYGYIRNWMGVENASILFYDDPALARDMVAWEDWKRREYWLPLVERLRPEADFTRVDAPAPSTLKVTYRKPDDADVPALMKASDAAIRTMVRFAVVGLGSRSTGSPLETASIPV